MNGMIGYRNPDAFDPEAVPVCERCGEPLWGTIQAEIVPKGEMESTTVHEACVEPDDRVLRVLHDDERIDHKD